MYPDGSSCESTLVARKAVTRDIMLAGERDGVVVVVDVMADALADVLDADDAAADETAVDWRSGVEGAVEPRYGCGEARCAAAAAADDEAEAGRDAEAVSVSR